MPITDYLGHDGASQPHIICIGDRTQNVANVYLAMEDTQVVGYHFYCPAGVRRDLACGSSAFIGEVNDSTILKYPLNRAVT